MLYKDKLGHPYGCPSLLNAVALFIYCLALRLCHSVKCGLDIRALHNVDHSLEFGSGTGLAQAVTQVKREGRGIGQEVPAHGRQLIGGSASCA